MLTRSVLIWSVAAVLLFWAVGAYNRLMRLRADANSAFAAVDAELGRQIDLVRNQLPLMPQPERGDASIIVTSLQAAASQLAANLAAARPKPLDAERAATLCAAQDALEGAWARARQADAPDQAGLPDAVLSQRAQLVMASHAAIAQFNQTVLRYNAAIAQFPAVLLAVLFGFKPARALSQVSFPS